MSSIADFDLYTVPFGRTIAPSLPDSHRLFHPEVWSAEMCNFQAAVLEISVGSSEVAEKTEFSGAKSAVPLPQILQLLSTAL
jgi:hypothetical protein